MKDIDIRKELSQNHLSHYFVDHSCRVVHEMGINQGSSIIDIAVINGSLTGFEIKSERDTLKRLPNQIKDYLTVFDYLYVVTSQSHLQGVLDLVPKLCGILSIEHYNDITKIEIHRAPERNESVCSDSLLQLLWKDEILDFIKAEGHSGMTNKTKAFLRNFIIVHYSKDEISNLVREKVFNRANWK